MHFKCVTLTTRAPPLTGTQFYLLPLIVEIDNKDRLIVAVRQDDKEIITDY